MPLLWQQDLQIQLEDSKRREQTGFIIQQLKTTIATLYGFSKSVDRVSSQQHRKGHVLPDVGRYALQWAGGRERNPVCLLPCYSHCRSLVPQLYDGQAFSE